MHEILMTIQKHRITEGFMFEGTSGGHLVQLPCSGRAT